MINIHKITKKALAAVMSVAMLTGLFVGMGIGNIYTAKAKDYGISNPRIGEDGSVTWDKIKFGSYKQTVEFEYEPIKWRILSVDENNNALLLADKGLDCKPYNEEYEYVTWETSTLRSWLNEDFYNEAFNESEQAEIKQVNVKNDDNPEYGTEGGNDTTDKVYLLSIEEASNSAYGFDSIFDTNSVTRECKVTDYAKINGASRSINSDYLGNGSWWLRSTGDDNNIFSYEGDYGYFSSCVNDGGWGDYHGDGVSNEGLSVRPVLQINLSSFSVEDAGEMAANGIVTDLQDGYNNPRTKDGMTIWDCVYFGRYKQNALNIKKEAIEWRVLSVDGYEALLLADKGLDCKPYNSESIKHIVDEGASYKDYSCTWETSTLRTWLNQDFYNEAFNDAEQSAVRLVTVKNNDNSNYGTEGGNDTTDKVYLLSVEEACIIEYGFNSTFDKKSDTRECKVTDYARYSGAYRSRDSDYDGNGYWWLRIPGFCSENAAIVNYDGCVSSYGAGVYEDVCAIRPALRIDLSSSAWEVAGTVSTVAGSIDNNQDTLEPDSTLEPDVTQPPNPSDRPDVTQEPTNAPQPTATPDVTRESQPTPDMINNQVTTSDSTTKLKSIKLTSVKCKKGAKQITGKVSVSKATVKIKVGSKAYKKATVKGKKFTLKVPRLKKNTKVTIKVTKSGYKSLIKTYKVK